MKFTAVLEQTVVASAEIATEGVTGAPVFTVVALEVKLQPVEVTVQVYTPGIETT